MIKMIYGKRIDVQYVGSYNTKYYSFKDVCDLLDFDGKERTQLGRKVANLDSVKIPFKTRNGAIKEKTYCSILAVSFLIDQSKKRMKRFIKRSFYNNNNNKKSILCYIIEKINNLF